jgi:tetratricopeptide (TPR) repeat protein
MARPGGAGPKVGVLPPSLPGRGPGGWMPPVGTHSWAPPVANIPGPNTAINSGNIFAPRMDNVTGIAGRGVNDFAGGWTGLSAAADAVGRYDLARGAAGDLKGLYNREYARDLLNRWPWWSGGDWGSGGSGSSGSGYSNPYSDSGYSNPYSTEAQGATDSSADTESHDQNDAESRPEPSKEDAANTDKETAAAKQSMEKAVLAFQNGDYAGAQKECERAIRLVPGNASVHEFCALCQFAQGKYKDAAGTVYKVLAAGPGWDWNTLNSFYESAQTYSKQLRALEEYVKEHPKDAAGRFLLAYHYLVLDERAAAVGQLKEVVKLQPKDRVSVGILKALEKAQKGKAQAPADKPAPGR